MKKLLVLALVAFSFEAFAQTFPIPSPHAKVYQLVGLNEMEISYSSPGVKDRVIFGGLVPNNEVWRTGANAPTTLTASESFVIDNQTIDAGTYSIFTVPGTDKISFILNSNPKAGAGNREKKLDVVRIEVPFNKETTVTERLQFTFENTTINHTDIVMRWSDRSFTVPVKVDSRKTVETNFRKKQNEFASEYSLYSDAANYFYEIGDYKMAVEMAEKSTKLSKKFWNTHMLAKAYAAVGDKKNAKEAAQESMKLSAEAKADNYVKMNEKLISEL